MAGSSQPSLPSRMASKMFQHQLTLLVVNQPGMGSSEESRRSAFPRGSDHGPSDRRSWIITPTLPVDDRKLGKPAAVGVETRMNIHT